MAYLTVTEAADVLADWSGQPVTPRQLRYLTGRAGSDAAAARTVACHWSLDEARLVTAEDLTVLALFVRVSERFHRWGLPQWRARAVLLYLEADMRAALAARRPVALVLDPLRGTGQLRGVGDGEHAIALHPLAVKMAALIAARREDEPDVWTGRTYDEDPQLMTA